MEREDLGEEPQGRCVATTRNHQGAGKAPGRKALPVEATPVAERGAGPPFFSVTAGYYSFGTDRYQEVNYGV